MEVSPLSHGHQITRIGGDDIVPVRSLGNPAGYDVRACQSSYDHGSTVGAAVCAVRLLLADFAMLPFICANELTERGHASVMFNLARQSLVNPRAQIGSLPEATARRPARMRSASTDADNRRSFALIRAQSLLRAHRKSMTEYHDRGTSRQRACRASLSASTNTRLWQAEAPGTQFPKIYRVGALGTPTSGREDNRGGKRLIPGVRR